MDAPQFNGDDNRDSLSADYEEAEYCPDCRAHLSEPCAPECGCKACRQKELAHMSGPEAA